MKPKDMKYLLAYLTPLIGWYAIQGTGWQCFSLLIFVFIISPVIDQLLPRSTSNVSESEESERERSLFFDLLLYANLPIMYYVLWIFLQRVYAGNYHFYELLGIVMSMGLVLGSMGINVAHEIGHRDDWFNQWVSRLLLLPNLYMHFNIEHNRGHHKWVATPEDPATARKGQHFYSFFVQSVVGSYRHAWQIQMKELKDRGHKNFSLHNLMLIFQLTQLAYLLVIYMIFGAKVLLLTIFAAIGGFTLLELVNYIEHYGLLRKKLANGRYETVQPHHSWNSNHEFGRILLYELTRHSDHHYKATRKYQVLRHFDDSPQLPLGYPGSILMAMFPPLWMRYMDGLLGEV